MRHSGTILFATAALALAGCGAKTTTAGDNATASSEGGAEVAAAASDFDPCSIITADEMSAITTDKVQSATRDAATCHYKSNPDDGVQVSVYPTGGRQQMKTVHNAAGLLGGMGQAVADKGAAGKDVAAMLKPGEAPPPKLGDEAVWEMNTTLAVLKGDAFVEVQTPIMHDPASHSGYPLVPVEEKRKIAIAVATKVLAKIAP